MVIIWAMLIMDSSFRPPFPLGMNTVKGYFLIVAVIAAIIGVDLYWLPVMKGMIGRPQFSTARGD
jgi:hypothetical protein